MLDRFCEKLAKDWEVERGFSTNIAGVFAIPLDEDLEIVLTRMDDGYTMMAVLAPCLPDNKEEFYLKLLAGNTLGQFTKGSVLALDDKDYLILSQKVNFVSQYRDFCDNLDDFIDTVDVWRGITKEENAKRQNV